ncbi:hypothetical protein B0H14DRAFT_3900421 [Mycena olivaceomarginata]|nr:hypothetical protein B0H14DRAFT_3900421 [Mycena olivaceomarginata]
MAVNSDDDDAAERLARSARSDARARIASLDVQLRVLGTSRTLKNPRMNLMFVERQSLQALLDAYKYPILALSNELTAIIFTHFLPAYPECAPLSGLFSPALLGQICQQWREIAFGTPGLWRSVKLYLKRREYHYRNCPLSISLGYHRNTDPRLPELRPFTNEVLSHSTRWEQLTLFGPAHNFSWIVGPTPNTPRSNSSRFRVGWISVFTHAASLRRVDVDYGLHPSWTTVLPWSQLISVSLNRLNLSIATEILRQAVLLVEFRYIVPEWNEMAVVPADVPPLAHLQSLVLHSAFDGAASLHQIQLLGLIIAPALRHLSVSDCDLTLNPIPAIASFLSRSQ